jgi:arylsulfatase A-like enzyme
MIRGLSLPLALWLVGCQGHDRDTDTVTPTGPNILLIVVDDFGYADFEPFGNSAPEVSTPNITRLADSGMVFTEAYTTAPVCSPSRAGLNTGKNQLRWNESAGWLAGLPAQVKTIAEYLKEAGYRTSRIGKSDYGVNYHLHDAREYPLHHGYDEFLGFSAHAHDYWLLSADIRDRTPDPYGTSAVLGPLMHNAGEKSYNEGYLTEILTDEAIRYIRAQGDTRFFLTLSYNALHHLIHEVPNEYLEARDVQPIANYDPDDMVAFGDHEPGSYLAYYDKYSRLGDIDDERMRKFYLANLDCLDDNIGRVLDALDEEGLSDETLVILISDNGGSPLTGASNAPLTAGKYSLWEGGIRVPLAVRWPGRVAPGQVQTQYVSATDILPTVADAADIPLADDTLDGRSLLDPDPQRVLVWRWEDTWAVRKGDFKLTNADEEHWKGRPSDQYIEPISNDLSTKLFNLADDPGERQDLVEAHPEKVEELQEAYQSWCASNIGDY